MLHPLHDVAYQAIAHIPVACIVSLRSTTEIVAVNDAAVEVFGYDRREEMLVLDITTLTATDYRSELEDNYRRTFEDGLTKVKVYQRRDGTPFEVQLFAQPMVGHADLAIAVIIDLGLSDMLRAAAPASP